MTSELGRQSGRRMKKGAKTIKAHYHHYAQHPTWTTHVYCKICGLAITKTLLPSAIDGGATSEV